MCIRQGHLECLLEYLDFPDESKYFFPYLGQFISSEDLLVYDC